MNWEIALKILEIVVSWPVAFLISSMTFIVMFRPELRKYLDNVTIIKLPGGAEFERQAISISEPNPIEINNSKLKFNGINKPIEAYAIKEIEKKGINNNEMMSELVKAYVGGHIYKFRFLNEFYVEKTKDILHRLREIDSITKEEFYKLSDPIAGSREQSDTVLSVFLQFGMVVIFQDKIEVTEQAKLFLDTYCA